MLRLPPLHKPDKVGARKECIMWLEGMATYASCVIWGLMAHWHVINTEAQQQMVWLWHASGWQTVNMYSQIQCEFRSSKQQWAHWVTTLITWEQQTNVPCHWARVSRLLAMNLCFLWFPCTWKCWSLAASGCCDSTRLVGFHRWNNSCPFCILQLLEIGFQAVTGGVLYLFILTSNTQAQIFSFQFWIECPVGKL